MEISMTVELSAPEEKLIQIVRKLPPARVAQLVDFAHFLAFQTQTAQDANGWDEDEVTITEAMRASEEKWDNLLALPDAKQLMRKMAQEALEEHHAGRTLDVTITEDGRLTPA